MRAIMSWEKLAEAARARRKELRLTQTQVAERGDLSVELLRMIENNRSGRLSARKAQGLERALGWKPGSVTAVLGGGSPALESSFAVIQHEPAPASIAAREGGGDRFALAHHVLSLRGTFAKHQNTIGQEAREALVAELARSAREAEESIIRMMPWLDDTERGEAIDLLVDLRNTVQDNASQ
jgi:transcriptional regulator with XRE-family HTH domain